MDYRCRVREGNSFTASGNSNHKLLVGYLLFLYFVPTDFFSAFFLVVYFAFFCFLVLFHFCCSDEKMLDIFELCTFFTLYLTFIY